MNQYVEISNAGAEADTEEFLIESLKTKIVAVTFGTQDAGSFELETSAVNRTVLGRDSLVFCTAPVFLTAVPVFVVT